MNPGYDWQIDPKSAGFADMSIELCDGLPSGVGEATWSGDYFCPWTAVVVDIERYPFRKTFRNRRDARRAFEEIFLEAPPASAL